MKRFKLWLQQSVRGVAGLRAEAASFFAWWLHELREIAETLLGRFVPGLMKPLVVRVEAGALIDVPSGQAIDESSPAGSARVIALLAPAEVLTHEIVLPLAVERNLESAIDLHLERELPMPRAQVCLWWRVAKRDRANRRITVRVHVAHRQHVERLREIISARGLSLSRVPIVNAAGEFEGNFLPHRGRVASLRITPLDRKLLALCAGLAAAACVLIATQWIIERSRVGTELARVTARAQKAASLARELKSASAGAEALIGLIGRPDAVDVLTALTTSSPQEAWAYELDIKPASTGAYQVKLGGFAPAATTLVDTLEKTPQFDEVRLVSAASAGLGSGRDRLTLTARFPP